MQGWKGGGGGGADVEMVVLVREHETEGGQHVCSPQLEGREANMREACFGVSRGPSLWELWILNPQ